MTERSMHTATAVESTPDEPLPVSAGAGNRIESLDFIRGLAVMGILAANIVAFGQPFGAYMHPGSFIVPANDPGGWMWIAQFLLVDGKMRGLFALLFGAGMVLFVDKALAKGATRWLQARRLAILFAFGMLHFFLLWRGDILVLYSLCGAIALLLYNMTPKNMIVVAVTVYGAFSVIYTAMFGFIYAVAETPFGRTGPMVEARPGMVEMEAQQLADDRVELALERGGTWFDMIAHRFTAHGFDWIAGLSMAMWEIVPLMLLGMALYRLGLFEGRFDRGKQAKWGWAGVIAGSLLTLLIALWVRAEGFTYFGTLFAFIGASMLPRLLAVLGLAALLELYARRATGWLGQRVRAAGRMAFSNYLGTSLVMVLLLSGWTFGLFGRLDRPQLYLVMLLMWGVILAWSQPWLARFRYGPLEWLWRCLTYGKLFPFRRGAG